MAFSFRSLFTRTKFNTEDLGELEETLIQADFGVDAAESIVKRLRERAKNEGASTDEQLRKTLVSLIVEDLGNQTTELNLTKNPSVILVVGVNGVGKTTTIGKLAKRFSNAGKTVVVGAADTFRAAAVEQLATWCERAGVQLVKPEQAESDPASVAFQTVSFGLQNDAQVIVIDTAGRLQNKSDLMQELEKIRRVIEKQATISEVLLVVDATTGQNGLSQAKAFAQIAPVSGVVLTKLDGSAKGGIVYSIQRELGIPVKLIGTGEGIDDLSEFNAHDFAEQLIGGSH